MAINVTLGGVGFSVPEPGDAQWASNLTAYLVALATAFPQIGGQVGFTALTSATANPAATGQIRLAKTDSIKFRNNANTLDNVLSPGIALGLSSTPDDLFYSVSGVASYQLTGQPLAVYQTNAAQSIASGSFAVINFGTVVTDTDSAVTTGAGWKFTVPAGKGGHYLITANARFGALTANTGIIQLAIFIGGSQSISGNACDASNGATQALNVSGVLSVAAGQTIDVRAFQSQGANRSLNAQFFDNSISIKRLV